MRARIYQPPKTAMQSGRAGTTDWVLEFEHTGRERPDPLMGWIGGGGTVRQIQLRFATREEAIAYADKRGVAYDIELPKTRHVRPKAYADNFRFGRSENWTH